MRESFSALAATGLMALTALAPSRAEAASAEAVEAAIPKLEAYVEGLIEGGVVPGLSIAIVHGDQIYLNGFGVREVGKPGSVDADSVFQIASLSKPISSTIVAALVTGGALTWDTRIAEIDPGFQLYEAYPTAYVTVADLFAHHSGLSGIAGNELEGLGYDRDVILERLKLVKPLNSFRGGYSYSNFGLTAGAVAAAKAAGLTWEEASKKTLFEPLGMTSTSMRHEDFLSHENRAEQHVPYEGRWQAIAKRDPDPQAPAGGISSTARDLAKWLKLQLDKGTYNGQRLIDEAALEETHTPVVWRGIHPVSGLPAFYGLGWNLAFGPHGPVWAHAGAFSTGARTVAAIYPEEDLGITVLSNGFPTGAPDAVADTFADLVLRGTPREDLLEQWNALYALLAVPPESSKAYQKPPDDPSPPLALPAYTGTYRNAYLGNAIVEEKASTLVLKLGPDGAKTLPLTHFDRDEFVVHLYPETPDLAYGVSFRIGADGTATAMELEEFSDVGFGLLERRSD